MTETILQVNDLKKSYPQGTTQLQILNQLELKVKKGETVAIVGQSGSGKSTLLSLLAGLDHPDSGSIFLDGQEISKMAEAPLAQYRGKTMGIVFQQFHLMPHLTALENIRLPLDILKKTGSESSAQASAEKVLREVGLEDRKNHYPHQLSGGESQRIAIARAFVVQPSLLLADEPSGNLDTKTGDQVMNLLFDLSKSNNMSTVLVTHNEALAGRCDRMLRLNNGSLHQ